MNRVLVTGASGFLGREVVQYLHCAGYVVRAFIRGGGRCVVFPREVEVFCGDIRDPEAVKAAASQCRAVVHLAGKAHIVRETHDDDQEYDSINVEGTKNLLEAMVVGGGHRVVFGSSVSVFGKTSTSCADETTSPNPSSSYGQSKWKAECLVEEYATRTGIEGVSLRLPMVYGPTEKGNLFRMIRAIDRGLFPPLPKSHNVRSMLHVRNFLQAISLVLECKVLPRSCYIVTDAKTYATDEIYTMLRQALGKPAPIITLPLWALRAIGRAGDVCEQVLRRRMTVSSVVLEKLLGSAWYSSAAITRDLGYVPKFCFADAVGELVAYYRKRKE